MNSVGGNFKLNTESHVTSIPHEYMNYAIFNYNHDAIPKETLEKTLQYYQLTVDDISDELISKPENDSDIEDFDELIGGLDD